MFEHWMGPEAFRRGVQAYLKSHAFGNAQADDFLAALDAAGRMQIGKAFHTFLEHSGVPLVSVALKCAEGAPTVELEQTRYVPLGATKRRLLRRGACRFACATRAPTPPANARSSPSRVWNGNWQRRLRAPRGSKRTQMPRDTTAWSTAAN